MSEALDRERLVRELVCACGEDDCPRVLKLQEVIAAAEERGRDGVLRAHDGWWSDERVRVEIAEAEERGRRCGVEEAAKELERIGHRAVAEWLRLQFSPDRPAALAPRDSAPADYPCSAPGNMGIDVKARK